MPKAFKNGVRRQWPRTLGLAISIATATVLAGAGTVAQASSVNDTSITSAKIDPALLAAVSRGEAPAVLVKFRGEADLSSAFGMTDGDARATYVYETLKSFADGQQAHARQALASQFQLSESAHDYTVLWIDNSIAIAGMTAPMLDALRSAPNVKEIRLQREIELPVEPQSESPPWTVFAVETNLTHIQVPEVWALGFRGAGIIVANIDAGVRHTHQSLVGKYRGNLGGGTFNHNFNWYDPYSHSATPRFSDPHGSHTMGTMLGDDGAANQIGVAPDAKWMACIGFGVGGGTGATDAGLLECGQWTLAPYPTAGGGTPNPALRADVVNNSWGSCEQFYDSWYEGVINGWIAAGIVPVFSNGNNSNCGYPSNPPLNTVGNPGRSGKVLGIGSTGKNNGLYAPHSNKGTTDNLNPGLPNYPDHGGFANLKPNVSAPGVSIRAAGSSADTTYYLSSGTSMSAPHVAGMVALMWSAAPCLKGNYPITGTLIMNTATPVPVSTGSPSDGPGNVPNQATGWGEINALAAVNASIAFCATGAPPTLSKAFAPSTIATGGTSTLTITLTNPNATVATLDAALTDNLPAGVVVAPTPNASTTCGGSVNATAGGSTVSLASGGTIPASGSCTVTASVTAAANGSYLNTIPAGGLSTDFGDNTNPASATLTVNPGGTFVCSAPINHALPVTIDGFSINWATGALIDDDPATGYDINLYNSSGLTMFWTNAPAGNAGVAGTTTSADYTVLQSGAVIGPASTWSRTNGAMTSFRAGVDGYLGFRYACASGTCYGYAHLTTTGGGANPGFPATLVDYCHDTSGAPVTIGGGGTDHTVTPSVGTPSGTISPATPQTVADGATTQFTLTPDSGFQIDSVGGTCGGALAANVFTTNAVTADCTVIANFVAGGADPVIDVDPASLGFTVDEGASDSAALTIANIGGGTLDWAIQEGTTAQPSSSHMKSLATRRAGPETAATLMRSGNVAGSLYGTTILLGDHDISQTADNAPGDEGVSCGVAGTSTADNSWWRRFYFNEHPAVGASSNVTSVTITSGSTGPNGVPFTVNLYTLPHSTAVNTIPTGSLTLIGTATGTIDSGLAVVNVPVTGAIDDTVGKDLVVEWHTDGNAAGGQFFPGANASAETHPTFLSSVACGLASPTTASAIGFPDFHLVMVVSLTNGGGGPTCQNPADVPWLSVSPAAGSLAGGASQDATVSVDATGVAAGSYSANLCVTSNDPVNPLVNVPVALTVEAVVGEPCSAADTIFCDGFDLPDVGDPDIVTGAINLPVNNDFDGNALDLVTGTYLPWNAARVDDVNFYNGGDGLYVYWYGDAVPGQGGVSSDGVTFDVLQSGATIGPASQIIAASIALTGTWWNGADGYFGIAFMNESTGAMNYGYVHVTTSSPDGYPAQTLEYAYNQAGNPITIP